MSSTGRPPKARDDYMADAQALLHLSRAVKIDTQRSSLWRDEVIRDLKALAEKLINAPGPDGQLTLPVEKE